MKNLLLTIFALLITGGVYSQNTLHDSVYQKINSARLIFDQNVLIPDDSLELASAQHGCWIALFNIDKDSITTPSKEFKSSLSTTFDTTLDRVENYTSRDFSYCIDTTIVLRQQPNSDLVFLELFKTGMILDTRSKYHGFWIIKFEDKFENPIWYLVYTITD